MRKCCLPNDRKWNAACKYRRRDHKKRFPNCHVPDQVADLLRREREVPPNVRKEKKKQMDRDRIALKRLQEKEKVLENVRYNLGGKTRSPDVARKVARHFTRDISEKTIVAPAVKPQKPRNSPRMVAYNRG